MNGEPKYPIPPEHRAAFEAFKLVHPSAAPLPEATIIQLPTEADPAIEPATETPED